MLSQSQNLQPEQREETKMQHNDALLLERELAVLGGAMRHMMHWTVQHRARLSSCGESELATRATLETRAERLAGGEAKDLAAQLPPKK